MKVKYEDKEVDVVPYDFEQERDEDAYSQLCVWPATVVEPDEQDKVQEFFKEAFGLEYPIHIVGCVLTKPDWNNGKKVDDTGGRCDFLFFVHGADIGKFAVPRLQFGIRWWEDVVGNKSHKIYPTKFLKEAKECYSW